jgi:tetratricopeptide (TPR) repeat protein
MKASLRRLLVAVSLAATAAGGCGGGKKEPKKPVVDKKPKVDPTAALEAARAAAKSGDVETAHAKYVEAGKSKDVKVLDEHVKFLLANALPDKAVEVARTFYDSNPADAQGGLIYANALIGAGDFATAIDVAGGLVDLDDKSAAGYEVRGRAKVMGGKIDEGVEDLRKAIEIEPRNVDYLASLGSGLEQAKKPDEAALHLRAALAIDEHNTRAMRLLGLVLRVQFEHQESSKWLLLAVKESPNDPESWFQLAITQNELNDNLEAEVSAQKATALGPTVARYWYVYGELLRFNKKPEDAIGAYRKALDNKPPHPKAAGKLAKVLYETGKAGEAEVFLTELLQTDRNNADLWYNLGWAYSTQKKYKLGVEAFEKYLELASKDDGLRKNAEAELKALKKKVR